MTRALIAALLCATAAGAQEDGTASETAVPYRLIIRSASWLPNEIIEPLTYAQCQAERKAHSGVTIYALPPWKDGESMGDRMPVRLSARCYPIRKEF